MLLIVLSCNNTAKNDVTVKPSILKQSDTTFAEKLKSKPKIFLKFWSGMTYDDYFAVSQILEKEGVIKGGYYQYSKIEPTLKNNVIIAVQLTDVSSELYKLYQQKYNLPSLIKKSTIVANFVENNPEYNPSMTYTNSDNVTTLLPMCFKDNSAEILDNKPIKLVPDFAFTDEFMADNEYIINNDSVFIKIEQKIIESPFPIHKYSLGENKDIERYVNSTQGKEAFGTNLMGGFSSSCIAKNSKLRYVTETNESIITITYMSKKEYLKEKAKRDSEKHQKIIRESEETTSQRRVLREI